jgi:hypothetical protein
MFTAQAALCAQVAWHRAKAAGSQLPLPALPGIKLMAGSTLWVSSASTCSRQQTAGQSMFEKLYTACCGWMPWPGQVTQLIANKASPARLFVQLLAGGVGPAIGRQDCRQHAHKLGQHCSK